MKSTIPDEKLDEKEMRSELSNLKDEYTSLSQKYKELEAEYKNLTVLHEKAVGLGHYTEQEKEVQMFHNQLLRDNCPDIILLLDSDCRIVLATSAVKPYFGAGFGELAGRSFLAVCHEVFDNSWTAKMSEALLHVKKTKGTFSFHDKVDSRILDKDIFFSSIVSPAIDFYGDFKGIVVLMHDATDLNEIRLQAEKAAKTKSSFLANMSHEIRTPMTAIKGMSELLSVSKLQPVQMGYASNIVRATESLLRIVNDVLDFSKLESDKLELTPQEYTFSTLITDISNGIALKAEKKGLYLVIQTDPNIYDSLIGDYARVRQILVNLLNNAVKFTSEGYVMLSVRMDETDKRRLLFEVKDTGRGIKEEELPKIFHEFEQMDGTAKNKTAEGLGLGLAISKRLVEMMGGSITASSVYKSGTVFKFDIFQEYTSDKPIAMVKNPELIRLLIFTKNKEALDYVFNSVKALHIASYDVCYDEETFNGYIQNKIYTHFIYSYEFAGIINSKYMDKLSSVNTSCIKKPTAAFGEPIPLSVNILPYPILVTNLAKIFNGERLRESTGTVGTDSTDRDTIGEFKAKDASILLVDDNQVNLLVGSEIFKHYDIYADVATNGAEAIEKIKAKNYDIVFMDHMMPVMDGIEAIKEIRRLGFDRLPVIALTANAVKSAQKSYTEAGMTDYITKPIDVKKVNIVLRTYLPPEKIVDKTNALTKTGGVSVMENEEKSYTSPAPGAEGVKMLDGVPPALYGVKGLDVNKGVKALSNSAPAYLRILKSFVKMAERDRGKSDTFLGQKDLKNFTIYIHGYKGALAGIGADALSDLAKEIESASKDNDRAMINANMPEFLAKLEAMAGSMKEILGE